MQQVLVDEIAEKGCETEHYELDDYNGGIAKWCKGCGDLGILSSVQRVLRDEQVPPESVVCVSGIGCSSRFPHYMRTYGFHGIHGRALPLATGVTLARPDLKVIVTMGDGDCFSIGAGHWVHSIRYNLDLTALVFDNEIYGLTKKQASPTTRQGVLTNTTPKGAYLKPLNPLSVMMGITNISFLAQSATWLPSHLENTIKRANEHKGLAFVRILQRCPVFSEDTFYKDGRPKFSVAFLENENGIEIDATMDRFGEKRAHDQSDIDVARKLAGDDSIEPVGLLYLDESLPSYNEIRHSYVQEITPEEKVDRLNTILDSFSI